MAINVENTLSKNVQLGHGRTKLNLRNSESGTLCCLVYSFVSISYVSTKTLIQSIYINRQPYVTGTSVLGIKYKDGVLIAADTAGNFRNTSSLFLDHLHEHHQVIKSYFYYLGGHF